MSAPRYRLLTAEEQRALKPAELARYQAERRAFEREVEDHCEHIRRNGWLNVAPPDRAPVRFVVPVVLKQHARPT